MWCPGQNVDTVLLIIDLLCWSLSWSLKFREILVFGKFCPAALLVTNPQTNKIMVWGAEHHSLFFCCSREQHLDTGMKLQVRPRLAQGIYSLVCSLVLIICHSAFLKKIAADQWVDVLQIHLSQAKALLLCGYGQLRARHFTQEVWTVCFPRWLPLPLCALNFICHSITLPCIIKLFWSSLWCSQN